MRNGRWDVLSSRFEPVDQVAIHHWSTHNMVLLSNVTNYIDIASLGERVGAQICALLFQINNRLALTLGGRGKAH